MDNIWFWIILVSIMLLIGRKIYLNKANSKSKERPLARRLNNNLYVSAEDVIYKKNQQQLQYEQHQARNREIIRQAKQNQLIQSDTSRLQLEHQYEDTYYIIQRNLEAENHSRLTMAKFHRYTDLHYRAMLIDQEAYKDYCSAKAIRDELSATLLAIGKKQMKVTPEQKRELYAVKDSAVAYAKNCYSKMIELQQLTAELREKIRSECGMRGEEWYQRNMGNRHHA